jgi:hypothetical protein
VNVSGEVIYEQLVAVLIHSWREEFSIVKRAGNSCSPVRGSFLEVAMFKVASAVFSVDAISQDT